MNTEILQNRIKESGHNVPALLEDHAVKLGAHGIGPMSRMCAESLIKTEVANIALPQIHAEEGAKFAALARRIAPPGIVAKYIQQTATAVPFVLPMDTIELGKSCKIILYNTAFGTARLAPQKVTFTPYSISDSYSYFKFCARDPNILLGCCYLSLALGAYVLNLKEHIRCPHMSANIETFGNHFNATNLFTALPIALSMSLTKTFGESATPHQIDRTIILDALRFLNDNEQFAIHAKGKFETPDKGMEIILQCPMKGYLFELLGNNEVLQPIMRAIAQIDHISKESQYPQASSAPAIPRALRQIFHRENTGVVQSLANEALQLFV